MAGYVTASGNRLTTDGSFTYTYDAAGDEIGKQSRSTADTISYAYDTANHLTSVVEKSDGKHVSFTVTYIYDVMGRRVEQDKWLTGGSVIAWASVPKPSAWREQSWKAIQNRILRECFWVSLHRKPTSGTWPAIEASGKLPRTNRFRAAHLLTRFPISRESRRRVREKCNGCTNLGLSISMAE
jgi:hypothetical protein